MSASKKFTNSWINLLGLLTFSHTKISNYQMNFFNFRVFVNQNFSDALKMFVYKIGHQVMLRGHHWNVILKSAKIFFTNEIICILLSVKDKIFCLNLGTAKRFFRNRPGVILKVADDGLVFISYKNCPDSYLIGNAG